MDKKIVLGFIFLGLIAVSLLIISIPKTNDNPYYDLTPEEKIKQLEGQAELQKYHIKNQQDLNGARFHFGATYKSLTKEVENNK